jgi:hypothetical protein
MRRMDTTEFCERADAVLGGRGWLRKLSILTGKDYATVKRWANGTLAVPEYVATIIELLEVVPESRLPDRIVKLYAR